MGTKFELLARPQLLPGISSTPEYFHRITAFGDNLPNSTKPVGLSPIGGFLSCERKVVSCDDYIQSTFSCPFASFSRFSGW